MSKNENGSEDEESLDDLLDKPFFDPDKYDEKDTGPLGWFANLVKSDYELAETIYVGTIFVVLLVVAQEVLRIQIYDNSYLPFTKGGATGGGRLF
jgi:hypothetical protein